MVTFPSEREKKRRLFDKLAPKRAKYLKRARFYHAEMLRYLRFLIPSGASVLEIGCGLGDLLAGLEPSRGVGVDLSEKMIEQARKRHDGLEFHVMDAEELRLDEQFDFVVISDTIGHLYDVQSAFEQLKKVTHRRSRVIITFFNYLWEPAIRAAELVKFKMPERMQNWLTAEDVSNLLELADFETIMCQPRILMPFYVPLVSAFFNRFLGKMPLIRRLCLSWVLVARPKAQPRSGCTTTVVIPCRNERGNIEGAVLRTPKMGPHTELIFVDGNSTDGTPEEIERQIAAHPEKDITLIHQGDGVGKGDAVRKGFAQAKGDVLMILDADLTVPPEDLPKFYNALVEGKGDFINGTRLVYPMEDQAMRTLNLMGNRFFSRMFTWLLGQRFRDTLCGTKVLFKEDYQKIAAARGYFGKIDPFGDFDLLFGAAKQLLKIVEVPVHYRERIYGSTNIARFRHGWLLLKMCWKAFRKLKLV